MHTAPSSGPSAPVARPPAGDLMLTDPSEMLLHKNINCAPISISPHGVSERGILQVTTGSTRTQHCLVLHYTCSSFQITPEDQQDEAAV